MTTKNNIIFTMDNNTYEKNLLSWVFVIFNSEFHFQKIYLLIYTFFLEKYFNKLYYFHSFYKDDYQIIYF